MLSKIQCFLYLLRRVREGKSASPRFSIFDNKISQLKDVRDFNVNGIKKLHGGSPNALWYYLFSPLSREDHRVCSVFVDAYADGISPIWART